MGLCYLHTKIINSKHIFILKYVDLYRNIKFCLEFNAEFKYVHQNILSIFVRELYDFLPNHVVKFSKKNNFLQKVL